MRVARAALAGEQEKARRFNAYTHGGEGPLNRRCMRTNAKNRGFHEQGTNPRTARVSKALPSFNPRNYSVAS